MTSSFKSFKKPNVENVTIIPGTKSSPSNFSLLTSSGLPALDTLLGGGLPVGSLLLIEEDTFRGCSDILLKYFVSEGIHCGHKLFIGSKHFDLNKWLTSLPSSSETSVSSKTSTPNTDEDLAIAWRYKNLKTADTAITGKNSFGHNLQLKPVLSKDIVETAEIVQWPKDDTVDNDMDVMTSVIKEMEMDKHSLTVQSGVSQLLRVAILGLGSPMWDSSKIANILYCLRSWLRKKLAVGVVTIPTHLFQDPVKILSWIHFSDICIRLDTFAGTERENNAALKDYHGFFNIIKLPAFNSLAPHLPPSDLAYKIRSRKIVIERLSLPPELEDTAAREKEVIKKTGCGGARSTLLDF